VQQYFNREELFILDGGDCEKGIESTIIGFEGEHPVLYRHGSIAADDIEAVAGKLKIVTSNDSSPEAPGMLTRHYAPKTTTVLTENVAETIQSFAGKKTALLLFKDRIADDRIICQEVLSAGGNLQEAARNLYAAMHRLDRCNADIIIAEKLPDTGLGKTINDRLKRAVKQ
jgi:L-threonylcarbamoyladenylate synthase